MTIAGLTSSEKSPPNSHIMSSKTDCGQSGDPKSAIIHFMSVPSKSYFQLLLTGLPRTSTRPSHRAGCQLPVQITLSTVARPAHVLWEWDGYARGDGMNGPSC